MIWLWTGFIALILFFLSLDLGVFNRRAHVVSAREALGWTSVWVTIALAFMAFVYLIYQRHWFGLGLRPGHELNGWQAALEYLTGYLIEESLSLDNVFVIAVIIRYFRVPPEQQHRLLFWGVLGVLVFRGLMIGAGVALIERFTWVIYLFGAMVLAAAAKMLFTSTEEIHPERNLLIRAARAVYPVTSHYDGRHFFTRHRGRMAATPLFLALLVVESTDVFFALDSIPAIFSVTREPFIIFTSNVFAILGLRSLYFVLASAVEKFHHLKTSLVIILAYVGVKMLLNHYVHVPIGVSLGIIALCLAAGIVASVIRSRWERGR